MEWVEFGEFHVFTGRDFVVTIRHAEAPDLGQVRDRLEQAPALLRLGGKRSSTRSWSPVAAFGGYQRERGELVAAAAERHQTH